MKENGLTGKEILFEEIKVLQMDVLSAIDYFCSERGIRYSMSNGTLLGAVRHKGYIPWDDDIDIYVPREDYNRLISEFPMLYKGRYKIVSLERDSLWDKPYAKAYDDKTIMIENIISKANIGVNIDIFPIDEVPDDNNEWIEYDKARRRQQNLFALKFVKISSKRSLAKNIILLLFRLITGFYSTRKWAQKLDVLAQRHDGKGYGRCFECCQGIFQKKPFSKVLFDNIVDFPFEDRHFKAFVDADVYLRNGFGDYMQLPPVEKRVTHHSFKAYWK